MSQKIPAIIEIQDGEILRTFYGMFEAPRMDVEKAEIPYMSTSTWVAGRTKWTNPKLEFYDYYSKDFEWITEWIRSYAEYVTGRGVYTNFKKNIIIKAAKGEIIERWTLIGAQIVNANINMVYDFSDYSNLFPDILLSKLTRKVLIEKTNNPTMQVFTELELAIDRAVYDI
jgi:hypothetical protein